MPERRRTANTPAQPRRAPCRPGHDLALSGNTHKRIRAFRLSAQTAACLACAAATAGRITIGMDVAACPVLLKSGSVHRDFKKREGTIMRKLLQLIALACIIGFTGLAHAAAEHASADEAVAMVQRVIAYIKANGKEKAIAEINNLQGQFRDRDLYVTINDLNMKSLAHGANAKMQGKDLIDLKDADGKFFMRERLDLVKAKSKGWQDYKFVNPVTKQIEQKATYFERYQDIVVNCGIYKG
jgi:cytochrome c